MSESQESPESRETVPTLADLLKKTPLKEPKSVEKKPTIGIETQFSITKALSKNLIFTEKLQSKLTENKIDPKIELRDVPDNYSSFFDEYASLGAYSKLTDILSAENPDFTLDQVQELVKKINPDALNTEPVELSPDDHKIFDSLVTAITKTYNTSTQTG